MDLKTAKVLATGGRALEAVYTSKILTSYQKLLLGFIASKLNFRGTFGEHRWVSIATLMANTSLSRSSVKRVLDDLESSGYLVRQHRFKDGRQLANSYRLTDLIFEQYAATLPKSALKGLSITKAKGKKYEDTQSTKNIHDEPVHPEPVNQEEEVQLEPVERFTVDPQQVHSEPPYTPSVSSLRETPSFKGDKKGKCKDPISEEAIGISRLLFNPGGQGRWVDIRAVDAWANDVVRRHGLETLHQLKDLALADGNLGRWIFNPALLERYIKDLRQQPDTREPRQWVDMDGNIFTEAA